MTQQIQSLIARLEAAQEGSRDLDRQVAVASGVWETDYAEALAAHGAKTGRRWKNVRDDWSWTQEDDSRYPSAYTTSIDAALTLKPENWCVLLASNPNKTVCDLHPMPLGTVGEWPAHAEAKTIPLALCIAALKARIVCSIK